MLDEIERCLQHPDTPRAIIVAHPDDETLWCGGLMLRYPGNWTVICCSIPTRDAIRAWKFFQACETLGARGRVYPYIETRGKPLSELAHIDLREFTFVATHNEVGEYGHEHHKQINQYVFNTFSGPMLKFGYGCERKDDDLIVDLTDAEYEQKIKALKSYDHLMSWGNCFMPTWQALIDNYGTRGKHFGYDLKREYYGLGQ